MRARLSSNASEFSNYQLDVRPVDYDNEDNFENADLNQSWDAEQPGSPLTRPNLMKKQQSHLASILHNKLSAQADDDFKLNPEFGEEEILTYSEKVDKIVKLSFPATMCFLAGMIQENINLIFIGHLNDVE